MHLVVLLALGLLLFTRLGRGVLSFGFFFVVVVLGLSALSEVRGGSTTQQDLAWADSRPLVQGGSGAAHPAVVMPSQSGGPEVVVVPRRK